MMRTQNTPRNGAERVRDEKEKKRNAYRARQADDSARARCITRSAPLTGCCARVTWGLSCYPGLPEHPSKRPLLPHPPQHLSLHFSPQDVTVTNCGFRQHTAKRGTGNTVWFSAILNVFRMFLDEHGELRGWRVLLSPDSYLQIP